MNTVEAAIAKVLPDIFAAPMGRQDGRRTHPPNVVAEGGRNAHLTSLAGSMRHRGMSPEAIEAALLVENATSCSPALPDSEVRSIAASVGKYAPLTKTVPLVGYTLAQLAGHTFPHRKALLMRNDTAVFREGQLAQVYAERGIGKTWFSMTLALVGATGGSALGFHAPAPCRVAYIDGEMASEEIQGRFGELANRLGVAPPDTLTVIGADWQEQYLPRLDTDTGQAMVEPFVGTADMVFLDNRSCLFDPDGEKDPTAWQPAQDWLLGLRRRGKAVMLAHHSNRQGGARGHSKSEDPMNLLIKLARPEDYTQDQGARFMVTFEKSRGAHGAAVAPFLAHLTPDGWQTQSADHHQGGSTEAKILEYVRLAAQAGERPKSANAAIVGARVGRNAGLAAWADLLKSGAILKHHDGGFHVG